MNHTYLQVQELSLAEESNLSKEELSLLKHSKLNYLQLEQVRLAIEEKMDFSLIKKMAKPWITSQEMEEIRHDTKLNIPIDFSQYKKKPNIPFLSIVGVVVGCGLFVAGWNYRIHHTQTPYLNLISEDVTIACGTTFEPMRYVQSYSEEVGELILPERFSSNSPDIKLLKYELQYGKQSLESYLRVHIVDEQPPTIQLTQEEIELNPNDTIHCKDYLLEARDDVDGDVMSRVSCHYTKDPSEIVYSVEDSSGNSTSTLITVHFLDENNEPPLLEEPEEPKVVYRTPTPTLDPEYTYQKIS